MGAAHISNDVRGKVAIKAIKWATQLAGLKVVELCGKSLTRDMHVYEANLKWASKMQTWGEAGIAKEDKDSKTGDRGQDMMFIWYPFNRESDSVRMWNLLTNWVVVTWDIIWMRRIFYKVEKSIKLKDDIPTADDAVEYMEEEAEAESNRDS